MAKQRTSSRGRDAEIPSDAGREAGAGRSGMPPDGRKEPGSGPPQGPVRGEAQIEAALYEEALSGAPETAGQGSRSRLLSAEQIVTPEMEAAFLAEAFAAQPPPEPVAETPAPTEAVTMQEREEALFEPPPPEVDDLSSGVLPPRPSASLLDLDVEGTAGKDIQEPEEAIGPIELPDRQLTEEEKTAILGWLTNEKFQEMQQEIVKTYEQIREAVAENETVTNKGFNNLLKARDILLRRDAARMPQAEYYVEQTKALLRRIAVSKQAAKKYQWRILVWGILWAVAFVAVLVLLGQQWFVDIIAPSLASIDNLIDIPVFVSSMVWGGIGGAVAILYSLFNHIGARDFDPHYNISYVGKPFLGAIIGATAYVVLNLMIRVLGIFPVGLEGEGASNPMVAPAVTYVVAWASGFKENRILDLVDRVMKRIFSGKDEGMSA